MRDIPTATPPAFVRVLPTAQDATSFQKLNRKARRTIVSNNQRASFNKDGTVNKRAQRKHYAEVRYRRGVEQYGVCPTRVRPCDVQEELSHG